MDKYEMFSTTNCTHNKETLEPIDFKELIDMLNKKGEPQGVVLLPSISGFDVYQFPLSILKGALSLIHGKIEYKASPITK